MGYKKSEGLREAIEEMRTPTKEEELKENHTCNYYSLGEYCKGCIQEGRQLKEKEDLKEKL